MDDTFCEGVASDTAAHTAKASVRILRNSYAENYRGNIAQARVERIGNKIQVLVRGRRGGAVVSTAVSQMETLNVCECECESEWMFVYL